MKDLLYFDTMVTPKIITLVFWLMLLMATIAGLGTIFGGGLSFLKLIFGLLVTASGAVSARITCEILIVLFKIHENIKKLADKA